MEKPDPTCPTCHKPAKFLRDINTAVEFWECEGNHMFVLDKKPPPRPTAASLREAAAASAAAAAGEGQPSEAPPEAATEVEPKQQ